MVRRYGGDHRLIALIPNGIKDKFLQMNMSLEKKESFFAFDPKYKANTIPMIGNCSLALLERVTPRLQNAARRPRYPSSSADPKRGGPSGRAAPAGC